MSIKFMCTTYLSLIAYIHTPPLFHVELEKHSTLPNSKLPPTVILKITKCNITDFWSWWARKRNNVTFPTTVTVTNPLERLL